ncbi:MAG: single-stranded DNA-binding protein, partial [Chloroflexota bacterium]|nr:single-stranded DNA-binding protein [Chloroflexota bacterium]
MININMVQHSINNIEFDSDNDLDELVSILPIRVQDYINTHKDKDHLVEVILDLGKPPEVRFPNSQETIGE